MYGIGMAVDYTEHATFRMRQRTISKANVEVAIRNPGVSFITHFGRSVAFKKYCDKFLKVVYEKSNDKITLLQFIGRGDCSEDDKS
ncbi:MAG: DUF4258 domain-containing protein [Candidatus Bathyarchaeia archaeon]